MSGRTTTDVQLDRLLSGTPLSVQEKEEMLGQLMPEVSTTSDGWLQSLRLSLIPFVAAGAAALLFVVTKEDEEAFAARSGEGSPVAVTCVQGCAPGHDAVLDVRAGEGDWLHAAVVVGENLFWLSPTPAGDAVAAREGVAMAVQIPDDADASARLIVLVVNEQKPRSELLAVFEGALDGSVQVPGLHILAFPALTGGP